MAIKVPLTLDKRGVEKFLPKAQGQKEPGPDEVIQKLVDTIESTHGRAHDLAELSKRLDADGTLPTGAKAMQLRQSALKVADIQASKLDNAKRQAQIAIAELEEQIKPPRPRDQAEASMHAELRGRLSQMQAADRLKITTELQADTIAAIAGAPSWASGLSDIERAERVARWQRQKFPKETERLERLKGAVDGFDRAAQSFMKMMETAANNLDGVLAERQADRTREAKERVESTDD